MTREEKEKAIECLAWFKEYNEEDYCGGDRFKNEYDEWFYRVTEQDFEIFDMIIDWLEQEPKTDYKALGDELRSVRNSIKGDQTLVGYNLALSICNKYLSDSEEQEPRTDYKAFAEWVAGEIFSKEWEFNKDSFAEVACRKLSKMGLVKAEGENWALEQEPKSEQEIGEHINRLSTYGVPNTDTGI